MNLFEINVINFGGDRHDLIKSTITPMNVGTWLRVS